MAYDLIKISGLPLVTPDSGQDIVVGVGDLAKRINYGDVKADMVGTSPSYTTDTEPYLMRRTAHTGVVGKCALNKLVGGSLGWNQLLPHTASTGTSAGITFTNNNDGSWTLTGTGTNDNAFLNLNYVDATTNCFKPNHVYLAKPEKTGSTTVTSIGMRLYGIESAGIELWGDKLIKAPSSVGAYGYARLQVSSATNINIGTVTMKPQIYDLTQMFGSTIADYVYGLESATAGAGVAWLRKYIDIDSYHTYDAGSIQSVQPTAHVTKDANNNVIGNYPLGSDTLRGYPMLVNNKLAFDGDEKLPDGTITRKYGIVDLGTLTFTANGTITGGYQYVATIPNKAYGVNGFICPKFVVSVSNELWTMYGRAANAIISFNSTESTVAAFKTAMSGVYLVYPLATETTESSTSYQKVQTIDADGTESFTTSTPVPVGHETQTPDNILSALEWLGE